MVDLTGMTTEVRNPSTTNLDMMTPLELATVMNSEDEKVILAVRAVLPQVAIAIEWTTAALKNGGRIIYIGAGTSGRLGVLDAAECPPTFGVSSDRVVGLIAGGESALVKSVEGAEDSHELGTEDLKAIGLDAEDVVIGLSASGRTPYVLYALRYARSIGCKTAVIACNSPSVIGAEVDLAIEPITGPEVLTGSTRLKAGTAQKLILNMISTGAMAGVGKVYENLMVDVQQTNEKLVSRARNIVVSATGCSSEEAVKALEEADGSAKVAIVMILGGFTAARAREALEASGGRVREAIVEAAAE